MLLVFLPLRPPTLVWLVVASVLGIVVPIIVAVVAASILIVVLPASSLLAVVVIIAVITPVVAAVVTTIIIPIVVSVIGVVSLVTTGVIIISSLVWISFNAVIVGFSYLLELSLLSEEAISDVLLELPIHPLVWTFLFSMAARTNSTIDFLLALSEDLLVEISRVFFAAFRVVALATAGHNHIGAVIQELLALSPLLLR